MCPKYFKFFLTRGRGDNFASDSYDQIPTNGYYPSPVKIGDEFHNIYLKLF